MATNLNALGVRRTIDEWKHIWSVWVQKTKCKARKIRDQIQGTGGGPEGESLTPQEEKIIEIVGSASIYGFIEQEFPQLIPQPPVSLAPTTQRSQTPPPPPPIEHPTRRRRRLRPARPTTSESLARVLERNNMLFRESLVEAANIIASAIRDAGEAIAAVSRDSERVIVVSASHDPENNNS